MHLMADVVLYFTQLTVRRCSPRLKIERSMMHSKTKGFTAIELLIVIAIVGILVAVIFIALDPATRYGQARDAVRQDDVQEILSAAKFYQVDHDGEHVAAITELDAGDNVYMITNGAVESGCAIGNAYCGTEITADTHCVDLSELVEEQYLNAVPVSPSGVAVWDEGSLLGTGYTLSIDSNGILTVRACENEQGEDEIQVSR